MPSEYASGWLLYGLTQKLRAALVFKHGRACMTWVPEGGHTNTSASTVCHAPTCVEGQALSQGVLSSPNRWLGSTCRVWVPRSFEQSCRIHSHIPVLWTGL